MKKEIRIPITQEAITLVPNVVYKMERFWYDMTLRPMKMSVLMPKHWQEHKPQPLVLWLCFRKRKDFGKVYLLYTIVLVVFLVLTPFISQLDVAHQLITATMAVRCGSNYLSYRQNKR